MRLLRFASALLLVGIFAWGASLMAVYLFGRRDEARPADAIVVLGAAQYQGKPSPVLRARLDHAIELYGDSIAPSIIFTGGLGVGDTISEAEVGRRYAIGAGIPSSSILIERAGVSTKESMRAVSRFMRARGMDSAVLVSDPFHMLRLRILAAQLGIEAYSSPTRSSPIRLDSREEWKHVFRESLIIPLALLGRL